MRHLIYDLDEDFDKDNDEDIDKDKENDKGKPIKTHNLPKNKAQNKTKIDFDGNQNYSGLDKDITLQYLVLKDCL